MRLIIAGGRRYHLTVEDHIKLNNLLLTIEINEVVSGCATGVDQDSIKWAEKNNIIVKKFPANWDELGKQAGYLRNLIMAKYADAVVLFPGGKGTNHMYDIAKKHELVIYDYREAYTDQNILKLPTRKGFLPRKGENNND